MVTEGGLDMLHCIFGSKVDRLVVRLPGSIVNPLLPVRVDLLGGAHVHDKGVRVPGLGRKQRIKERVVHPVPTMVL